MKYILFFFISALTSLNLLSQYSNPNKENFYFDAIVFKGESSDSSRVDIYLVVPNERLNFLQTSSQYSASFEIIINILDSLNSRVLHRKFDRNVIVDSYSEAQGGKAEFSQILEQVYLLPGSYKINVTLRDLISQREFEKSRALKVIDFSSFPFTMSALMLVSSIEENNRQYLISPHISDNIGMLTDGYFTFFEIYNSGKERNIDIFTEIKEAETSKVVFNDKTTKTIHNGVNQVYIRIPNKINYGPKTNLLRIYCSESSEMSIVSSPNILAGAERSIKNISFLSDRIATDLPTAIKQMRYVATSKEIDFINEATDNAEKLKRFENFWREFDPTPYTERNEALEEYYARIDYANKNFKAYSEGWLTDKGHVFIVFGPPINVERNNKSYSDNRTYEQWTYSNNRVFIFIDVSGFGDFRLYNPTIVTDKYRYNN